MKNFKNTLIALAIVVITGLCSSTNAFGQDLWPDLTAMKNKNQSISDIQMSSIVNKALLIWEQSGQALFNVDGLNPRFLLNLPREEMTQNEKNMLADVILENDRFAAEMQAFTKNMNQSNRTSYAIDIMQQVPMMIDSKPSVITHLNDTFKNKYQM